MSEKSATFPHDMIFEEPCGCVMIFTRVSIFEDGRYATCEAHRKNTARQAAIMRRGLRKRDDTLQSGLVPLTGLLPLG